MGLDTYVPSLWAPGLLEPLYKNLVFGSVVNRDYEGMIRQMGDSVRINEIGNVTISDYTKYGGLSWQELESAQKTLLIDQASSFAFAIDDVDAVQAAGKDAMSKATRNAGYGIGDEIDQHIAGLYTDAGITVTAITATASNILEWVADCAEALSEANAIGTRWMIIPPKLHTVMLLAVTGGINNLAVPKLFDASTLANGYVGNLYGFNILLSNNVQTSSSTVHQPLFFTSDAISFAGQLTKVKAVEREDYFDEGLKGLYVYGSKVVRPAVLGTSAVTKA